MKRREEIRNTEGVKQQKPRGCRAFFQVTVYNIRDIPYTKQQFY